MGRVQQTKSFGQSMNSLNLLVALSIMVFSIFSMIQVELMGDLINWVEGHPQLPAFGSLMALFMLAISGDTRSPDDYHEVEIFIIMAAVGWMVLMTFFDPARQAVTNNNPWTGMFVVSFMLVASAIMGR